MTAYTIRAYKLRGKLRYMAQASTPISGGTDNAIATFPTLRHAKAWCESTPTLVMEGEFSPAERELLTSVGFTR